MYSIFFIYIFHFLKLLIFKLIWVCEPICSSTDFCGPDTDLEKKFIYFANWTYPNRLKHEFHGSGLKRAKPVHIPILSLGAFEKMHHELHL